MEDIAHRAYTVTQSRMMHNDSLVITFEVPGCDSSVDPANLSIEVRGWDDRISVDRVNTLALALQNAFENGHMRGLEGYNEMKQSLRELALVVKDPDMTANAKLAKLEEWL